MSYFAQKEKISKGSFLFNRNEKVYVKIIRGVAYAYILFHIFSTILVIQTMPSSTMAPAIEKGNRVVILKSSYGIKLPLIHFKESGKTITFSRPKRGDIVLICNSESGGFFSSVIGFISFGILGGKKYMIKRVIGLPKEKIEIRDKKVYINNSLLEESYPLVFSDSRVLSEDVVSRDNMEEFIIPYNSYFLMGDNRDYSHDSRNYSSVDFSRIEGKVIR